MNVLDLSLIEENELKAICKRYFSKVEASQGIDFASSLFPIKKVPDYIDMVYRNMVTFYNLKLDKQVGFDAITQLVLAKAQKNQNVLNALRQLFGSYFKDRFRKQILRSRGAVRTSVDHEKAQKIEVKSKKVLEMNMANAVNLLSDEDEEEPIQTKTTPEKIIPANKQTKKEVKKPAKSLTIENNSIPDLSAQLACLCGVQEEKIDGTEESEVLCIYCLNKYHADCMKKGHNTNLCIYCHLKKLNPTRQTQEVLFSGLLKKQQKKHEIIFSANKAQLSKKYKIQVRCIRLDKGCQNIVQFPDAAKISLNNKKVKELIPLHYQSSLKFRKDGPFILPVEYLGAKHNKLIVLERGPLNQDERINPVDHLIGIYLIKERNLTDLIKEVKDTCVTPFKESEFIIDKAFEVGKYGDEITLELAKVPLICSLSLDRLEIPARGRFCMHINCFDLCNFLRLTCGSDNPRWVCPICQSPVLDFRIDVIILTILQEFKNIEGLKEVTFQGSSSFQISTEGNQQELQSRSLNSLPIKDNPNRETNIAAQGGSKAKKRAIPYVSK